MKDRSLHDEMNQTFFALTSTTIHHCLLAGISAYLRVPPECGPRCGAQAKRNTRPINHVTINGCTDVIDPLDMDFHSSSPKVQATKMDIIHRMFRRRIHSTGTDPGMSKPHNEQRSFDWYFLNYNPEVLIEQPANPFHPLCSFVAATAASMQFSAGLPKGESAIASSGKPVPCSDSNSNSNKITNITRIVKMRFVDGRTMVEDEVLLRGLQQCR